MSLILSKLSTKSQTVIPIEIRQFLGLKVGDSIRYIKRNNRIEIEKVKVAIDDDPFMAFAEWASDNDENAYRDL